MEYPMTFALRNYQAAIAGHTAVYFPNPKYMGCACLVELTQARLFRTRKAAQTFLDEAPEFINYRVEQIN